MRITYKKGAHMKKHLELKSDWTVLYAKITQAKVYTQGIYDPKMERALVSLQKFVEESKEFLQSKASAKEKTDVVLWLEKAEKVLNHGFL